MTRSFDLNRRSALFAATGLGLSVTFLGHQAFAILLMSPEFQRR